MGQNELLAKIREMKELQQIMDEAAAEIESIKDELKAVSWYGSRPSLLPGSTAQPSKRPTPTCTPSLPSLPLPPDSP